MGDELCINIVPTTNNQMNLAFRPPNGKGKEHYTINVVNFIHENPKKIHTLSSWIEDITWKHVM